MKQWIVALGVALVIALDSSAEQPKRIVSLIPAVTEMIFAMGEGARVVGVSNYDRYPTQVAAIDHVGGLLDPNVERILALRPDLVIVYNTQQELKERLDRASIPYFSYEHRALPDVTATLRALGARIGSIEADRVASRMEADLDEIRRSVAGRKRPKTLLVFGREAGSLRNIDASGGYGFLHDMLEIAGGENVFADVRRQSVQVTIEMILARRPEVILELKYGDSRNAADLERELRPWSALSSVPAVRSHQVHALVGDEFVIPGPRVVNATRRLAQTLHPDAIR